ncbi:cellulose binding domain-containing protein, partial [Streptomyces sp. SAS_260]|uniref:cellulose binding domain-containing protein n=1 Tax=Streptomyces sp. SAS_260 TaxID=3412751 RepID=UPI00403CE3A1
MDPGRKRRAVRRLWTAVAAAFALPLSMLATGTTTANAATVQCSVDYKTTDWGSGFTADLTLTNRGTTAIDGWTLAYGYTGNQQLANGWNGTWSQAGRTITVKNASYNGTLAPGGTVSAGAQFSYSGTNAAPTNFTVNGTSCVGAHQPPITVLTNPAAGAVYSRGDAVPLAATAAAADGATIAKMEFYDDTTLLGTDTSAPYTYSVSGLTVGSHSLTAKAYDSLGATGESTPVGITIAAGPAVVASTSQLAVQQGKTATYDVKLSTQPSTDVTVTTARTGGNTGLSVTGGNSLVFTPSNWNTAQKVTVTADSSGTGAATFESTAAGYGTASVTVTQIAISKTYDARFLDLYGRITNPANGYFSPQGIPYHSVETLIVEAPDQGHETTSEAYSYLLWL